MKTFRHLLKEFKLHYDMAISLLGLALVAIIFLLFKYPQNRYLLLAAFVSGGLLNAVNGLKIMKDPKKKNMGMSYLLMGLILIFIGMMVINIKQIFS